jgi:hypothetical protein
MLENLWAFWELYLAQKFRADDKGQIFFNSAQKIHFRKILMLKKLGSLGFKKQCCPIISGRLRRSKKIPSPAQNLGNL